MKPKINSNKGTTAIEYGLIVSGIALILLTYLMISGQNIKTTFCNISNAISSTQSTCSNSSSKSESSIPSGVSASLIPPSLGGTAEINAHWNHEGGLITVN